MSEKGNGEVLFQPGANSGQDHHHAVAEKFREDIGQGISASEHKVKAFIGIKEGGSGGHDGEYKDGPSSSSDSRDKGSVNHEILKDWTIKDDVMKEMITSQPFWQGIDAMRRHHEEPSKDEVQSAKDKVDGKIDGLISTADKATLKNMQDAALSGDPKAFSDAISGLKDDPARLKDFVKEMNKNLKDSDAGLHATVDEKGNVVLYGDHGHNGVEIGADGTSRVRALEREPDGTVIMKDGEVLNKDPNKVMKHLSDDAVFNIEKPPFLTLDNSDNWWEPKRGKLKPMTQPDDSDRRFDPKWLLL